MRIQHASLSWCWLPCWALTGSRCPCKGQTSPVLTSSEEVGHHQETGTWQAAGLGQEIEVTWFWTWSLDVPWHYQVGREGPVPLEGQTGFRQGTILCRDPTLRTVRQASCVRLPCLAKAASLLLGSFVCQSSVLKGNVTRQLHDAWTPNTNSFHLLF